MIAMGKQTTGLENTRKLLRQRWRERKHRVEKAAEQAREAERIYWRENWPHGVAVAWLGDVCKALALPPAVVVTLRMTDMLEPDPVAKYVWRDPGSLLLWPHIPVHGWTAELLERATALHEPFRRDGRDVHTQMLCPPPEDKVWKIKDMDMSWSRIAPRGMIPDNMVAVCTRMERYGLHAKPPRIKYETVRQYMQERLKDYGSEKEAFDQ
jgi:hypothetical protein